MKCSLSEVAEQSILLPSGPLLIRCSGCAYFLRLAAEAISSARQLSAQGNEGTFQASEDLKHRLQGTHEPGPLKKKGGGMEKGGGESDTAVLIAQVYTNLLGEVGQSVRIL